MLPLTVEEYQVGQLYAVARASKNETGGGEGIEVIKNEPFDSYPLLNGQAMAGQYTYKIYYLQSKVPGFIRALAPKDSLELHEEAWNAYPYCRTVLTNPGYMKGNFKIVIETYHAADNGVTPNIHCLPPELLKQREVAYIDIGNDPVPSARYKLDEDPAKFKSKRTGRGPLTGKWQQTADPIMTCYKLVTVEFKWFGLQSKVESFIMNFYPRLFRDFHRGLFCWLDEWHGMTIEEIRALEDETKQELDQQRCKGEVRGTKAD